MTDQIVLIVTVQQWDAARLRTLVLKSTNGDLGLHTTLQRWNRYTDPNCQVRAATIRPMFVRQFRVRVPLILGSICSTSAPLPLQLAESSRCDGVELRELQAEAAKRKVEVDMMKQSISGFLGFLYNCHINYIQ